MHMRYRAPSACFFRKTAHMQQKMQRRTFIRGAGLVAGTAFAATITQISALAEATSNAGRRPMRYDIKCLPFDPKNIKGLSEKLLISHYENNYSGAVKRLNTLTAQLAELDFAKTPVFVINGLKREELIAANSMILHELYFDGLGGSGAPNGTLADAIARDFGTSTNGEPSLLPWVRQSAVERVGCF